jgi:hypothetical protein
MKIHISLSRHIKHLDLYRGEGALCVATKPWRVADIIVLPGLRQSQQVIGIPA